MGGLYPTYLTLDRIFSKEHDTRQHAVDADAPVFLGTERRVITKGEILERQ